jgi:hypothetical protein
MNLKLLGIIPFVTQGYPKFMKKCKNNIQIFRNQVLRMYLNVHNTKKMHSQPIKVSDDFSQVKGDFIFKMNELYVMYHALSEDEREVIDQLLSLMF